MPYIYNHGSHWSMNELCNPFCDRILDKNEVFRVGKEFLDSFKKGVASDD